MYTLGNTARSRSAPPPDTIKLGFLNALKIRLKVFIQMLQKSHDRHKISFAFEFNNKTSKKSLGQICPPPDTIKLGFLNAHKIKSIHTNVTKITG